MRSNRLKTNLTCRIYRKAIGIADIDDIHTMISAWTRLERCYGTLDQLKSCQEQCQAALFAYNARIKASKFPKKKSNSTPSTKQPSKDKNVKGKTEGSKNVGKSNAGGGKSDDKNARAKHVNANVSRKHKLTDDHPASETKRPKFEPNANAGTHLHPVASSEKDAVTVFISNLPYEITADEIIAAYPELKIKTVDLMTSPNGRGRGFGYIELSSSDDVTLALSFDRRPINGRPAFISNVTRDKEKRAKFKYADAIETRKLFVKGLPIEVNRDEVEALFTEFGALKDVRLVTHK